MVSPMLETIGMYSWNTWQVEMPFPKIAGHKKVDNDDKDVAIS